MTGMRANPSIRRIAAAVVVGMGTCTAAGLHAQAALADVQAGQTVERIVSPSDTAQRYAVYLPPGYSREREWPILFAMDPRGRAMAPLRLFRPAAERLGWIIVSSYNSASDEKVSPNAAALGAMVDDVQRGLSIDGRRLYLAGFSGTARESWFFAARLPDHVAGIIGFGAGTPDESPFLRMRAGEKPGFAFFGGAGDADFNHDEVRALDLRLDGTPLAHRTAGYPGPHSWAPEPVATEAMEWMEVQAVKRGLAQRSAAWQDSMLAEATARAAAREAAEDRTGALVRYRGIVADFDGLRDASAAKAKVAALSADRDVRDELARAAHLATRDSALAAHHHAVFEALAGTARPPSTSALVRDLGIEALKRDALRTDDTLAALSARRLLQSLLAYTTFYGPRGYLDNGDAPRALLLLSAARAIASDDPEVCYATATTQVKLAHADDAFTALECLVAHPVDPAFLERDPDLAPLRADARFSALLARIRAAAQPAAPAP
ncbi:MAG: hypothetical protein JWM27_815 [Gemmatimonadetes bacterium]|nr:hypothetical protein [Gemmatimonadota bacterium]